MMGGFERTRDKPAAPFIPRPVVDQSATLVDPDSAMLELPGMTPSPRQMGYTGNTCVTCNSTRMVVSGHCEVCLDCGNSSGCS